MAEIKLPDIAGLPEPSKDTSEAAIVEWLESCFKVGEQNRRPYERMALLCLMFWGGNQWQSIERDLAQIYRRKVVRVEDAGQSRITNNRIHISARQVIGMQMSSLPEFEAVPATYDQEDVQAAKLGTRLIVTRDRADREDKLREEELLWTYATAECLRRTSWDPTAGRPGMNEGDVLSEVVNFFRYLKDANNIEDSRWIIEYDARTVDEARAMFGTDKLEPESVADKMRALDALAMNVVQENNSVREPLKHSVLVKRMCVKPCRNYPNGHWFIWANGKLLRHHDIQLGLFPYSRAEWFPIPGRLYPMSFIEPLMSDQRQINILLSQMQEVTNKKLRGDGVYEGPGRMKEEVLAGGRKVIYIQQGAKFGPWNYDINLAEGSNMLDRYLQDFEAKAGTNKPSLGHDTGREIRVTALQMLKEADATNVAWHTERYSRDHLCKINSQKIALTAAYATNLRLLDVTGTKNQGEIQYFRGADLRDTKDVVALPKPNMSPAMKQQKVAEAFKDGLLGPFDPANPGEQLAKRLQLRSMGLSDIEEDLTETYGSIDDLKVKVGEMHKMAEQAVVLQLEQAANPQPQVVDPAMMPPEMMPVA